MAMELGKLTLNPSRKMWNSLEIIGLVRCENSNMTNPAKSLPDLFVAPVRKQDCHDAENRRGLFVCLLLVFIAIGGAYASAEERLRLATTTSVQDSGLMQYLLPYFEEKHSCKVYVIAVGTGHKVL